jgi:hypothetical protein
VFFGPYNIYGDSHIYRTLPDNLIPSLKFHRHPSLHANIFEAETFLHVKNQPDVLYIKPKTWIVGNLNDSRLIAWSQLNDTILTEISHGINSMDSLALTDTKFYFQLTDNSSDTIIFVYLFHTDIGLKVGQSKLKIISHREISMLPLIPIQSSELKILVQKRIGIFKPESIHSKI